jgi:hypothetical protein
MTEGDVVEDALRAMRLKYDRGALKIRGYMGQRTEAEFRIPTHARGYDIGLRRNGGGSYEVVADWWGARGFDQHQFPLDLQRQYAVAATKRTLLQQGFSLVEEAAQPDGEVRLLLRRAV